MATFVNPDDEILAEWLRDCKHIAIVGLSDKPHRASHRVGRYLLDHGYRITPVNPSVSSVFGIEAVPTLADIAEPVDMVDCFRRSDAMSEIARDAVAINAKVLWMQLGVVHEDAAAAAQQAGLKVVMDRCTKIEHARLIARRQRG